MAARKRYQKFNQSKTNQLFFIIERKGPKLDPEMLLENHDEGESIQNEHI